MYSTMILWTGTGAKEIVRQQSGKIRDNISDQDWFKQFNKNSMEEFMRISRRFARFGMTPNEIQEAIKSACDFFNIPMPMMIKDLTNVKNGQTMFVNHNR